MKVNPMKRLFGLLIAIMMFFSFAIVAVAEEIEVPPAEEPVHIVTAAPVTAAPATAEPTKVPETEAPATEEPTKAPATEAPATEEPATATPDATQTTDPTQEPDPTQEADPTEDPEAIDDSEETEEVENEEEEEVVEEEKPFNGSVVAELKGTPGSFQYGQIVAMEAHLTGFEGFEYRICWEYFSGERDEDGEEIWNAAPGNNAGELYQFVLDKENANWYWRVVVEAW